MKLLEEQVKSNDPAFLYLNLHPNEEIKMIVRHHWAGFLSTMALAVAMTVAPFILIFLGLYSIPGELEKFTPLITLIASAFLVFLSTFLLGSWVNYYYDIIFITNERIINVDQEGLLSRRTSELNMRQVQNVSAEVNGILRSFFDFGLLVVETAGEGTVEKSFRGAEGYFTMEDIPDPNRVGRLIIELHHAILNREDGHSL